MKITLFKPLVEGFKRFPFVYWLTFLSIIPGIISIESFFDYDSLAEYLNGIVYITVLILIAATLLVALVTESRKIAIKKQILINMLTIVGLPLFIFFTLRKDIPSYDVVEFTGQFQRVILLLPIILLSTFVLPFLQKGNSDTWHYIFSVLKSLLISLLYATVLMAGLSLALGAFDWFWDITILDNQYAYVGLFSYQIVGILKFVSDLPDLSKKYKWEEPQKFLSVLAKYILIPLTVIYTVIVLPYVFTLPFRDEWPANQTTQIMFGFLGMGYGALIILYKGLTSKKDKFVQRYATVLAGVSIPMFLFWIYSVYVRFAEYGVTVNRLLLLTIVFWSLGISIYFLIKKEPQIKYLVASLLVPIFVVMYLPFSGFYFSQRSQIHQFKQLATQEESIVAGVVVQQEKPKDDTTASSLVDTVKYLNTYHSLSKVEDMLSNDIVGALDINDYGYIGRDEWDMETVFYTEGIRELEPHVVDGRALSSLTFNIDADVVIPEGYTGVEYVEEFRYYDDVSKGYISVSDEDIKFDISNELNKAISNADRYMYEQPLEQDTLTLTTDDYMFVITSISVDVDNDEVGEIDHFKGFLFSR